MSEEKEVPIAEGTEEQLPLLKRFAFKMMKAVANELIVVEEIEDEEIKQMRRETCNGCKYRDRPADMCKVCGCFLDLKIKSKTNRNKQGKIVVTHCPKGFWDDEEIAKFYNSDKTTQ